MPECHIAELRRLPATASSGVDGSIFDGSIFDGGDEGGRELLSAIYNENDGNHTTNDGFDTKEMMKLCIHSFISRTSCGTHYLPRV